MNLFESAEYAQTLSTCKKRKVGAALSIKGEVVAIGFNHADHDCHCYMHEENPQVEHAEVCVLKHYDDLSLECAEMAVTYVCCLACAKYIVEKGVRTVFIKEFRSDKMQGVNHLRKHNVEVAGWMKN